MCCLSGDVFRPPWWPMLRCPSFLLVWHVDEFQRAVVSVESVVRGVTCSQQHVSRAHEVIELVAHTYFPCLIRIFEQNTHRCSALSGDCSIMTPCEWYTAVRVRTHQPCNHTALTLEISLSRQRRASLLVSLYWEQGL